MMRNKQLRLLAYTSGVIALAGFLASVNALDQLTTSTGQADHALEESVVGLAPGAGEAGMLRSQAAMVRYERANTETRVAAFRLGATATLTPLLIFLNVLGIAGFGRNAARRDEESMGPA